METAESLYIHIPYCISKCAYCDFFSRASKKSCQGSLVPQDYVTALCNEISFRLKYYKVNILKTIYIGGGTPSLLSEFQLKKIFDCIKKHTSFSPDIEITVETNPDDIDVPLLETLSDCGVTRLSVGIQSMNDEALKRASRRADTKVNEKALSLLKDFWKGEVSVDLISGLPGDDMLELEKSIKQVVGMKPDHISLYSLTIEDETPFGRELASGFLIYDFDKSDKLWLFGRDFLEAHGYEWYEVSNFCKTGKECRHNLAYWTHKSYIGCGSGAAGTVYHADGSGERWNNSTELEKYIGYWNGKDRENCESSEVWSMERIDLETSEFEFFMMGLRRLKGISEKDFYSVFGKKLPQYFLSVFEKWEQKGLCKKQKDLDDCRYFMTREGILFLNRFLINMESQS